MLKQKIALFIFTIIILSCCKEKKEAITIDIYNLDTIRIPISEDYMQLYTTVQNQDFQEKLFSYNHKVHAIDVYDLKNKIPLEQLLLEYEGSNGFGNVNSFFVTSSNFIFQNQTHFIITDNYGKVQKRIFKKIDAEKYPEFNNDYHANPPIMISNFECITFDDIRNEIVFPVFPYVQGNYNNKNCIATLNIITDELTILPTPYAEEIIKNNYGMLSKPYILCKGDSIIYNFPMSSHIYIYNRLTQDIKTKNIQSIFTANLSEKLNNKNNDPVKHYLHATFFHGIKYDNYRNQYYRIHVDKSSDPSVYNNRRAFLTIIDHNFEKTQELRLNGDIYPVYNITPEGLLFEFLKAPFENDFSYMLISNENIVPIPFPEAKVENQVSDEILISSKEEKHHESLNDVFFDLNKFNGADGPIDFVYEHILYPPDEFEKKKEGVIFVSLSLDENGFVTKYEVIEGVSRGITDGFKNEALRIAKLIKRVDPQKYNNVIGFPIVFEIERYKKKRI